MEHQIVPESATTMLLGPKPRFELEKKKFPTQILHQFHTSNEQSFIHTLRFVNLQQELGIYHLLPAMPLQPIFFLRLKPDLCHTIVFARFNIPARTCSRVRARRSINYTFTLFTALVQELALQKPSFCIETAQLRLTDLTYTVQCKWIQAAPTCKLSHDFR